MDNLSTTETYILSVLKAMKDDVDIDNIINLVLGMAELPEENRMFLILEKLKDFKLLEIKKENLFDKFVVNNIIIKNNVNSTNDNTVSNCTKKISSSYKIDKKKHSKYEIRFFWPSNLSPEIYDLYGLVFDKKYYTHVITRDKYLLTKNNVNIKIRKEELQIKNCIKNINTISQFKKKKKISFPIKVKKIQDLLNQTVCSDSNLIKTPKELIMRLSNVSGIFCVDVSKERYVRKMDDHTKIEFSLIKIQGNEWKTICIESKNIQKVLALSLLINQKNAQRLSYDEFLQQYAQMA